MDYSTKLKSNKPEESISFWQKFYRLYLVFWKVFLPVVLVLAIVSVYFLLFSGEKIAEASWVAIGLERTSY